MMQPQHIVITASGKSTPIVLDRYVNGYAIGVSLKTAGPAYTLQYSLSDPNFDAVASFNAKQNVRYTTSFAASGVWFNWDDPLLVNASTNRTTNAAFSPTAIRVNVTAAVSAGNPMVIDIVPMGMDGG